MSRIGCEPMGTKNSSLTRMIKMLCIVTRLPIENACKSRGAKIEDRYRTCILSCLGNLKQRIIGDLSVPCMGTN